MMISASTALNLGSLGSLSLNSSLHIPQKPLFFPPTNSFSSSSSSSSSEPICSGSWKPTSSVKTAAAASVDSSDPSTPKRAGKRWRNQNLSFSRGQLYERLRNYGERSIDQDFWLVIEPKFLDKFPNITKRLKRPAVALVSTNAPWITFMKLRLDRVFRDSYEAENLEEALASNPVKLEFDKPEKWTAPYPKYEYGWWDPFLPPTAAAKV